MVVIASPSSPRPYPFPSCGAIGRSQPRLHQEGLTHKIGAATFLIISYLSLGIATTLRFLDGEWLDLEE